MQKKVVRIGILAAVLAASLAGCGKNKELYDGHKDGYTSITAVDGISFDVISEAARNATAITNISEDMSFEPNQTYVYKDGSTQYFIFRMDSIVFVAQKGTNFGLREAKDKLEAVQTGNIMGIYFTSPQKKLDFVEDEKNNVYKFSGTVTAQVAVTSQLYNDFAGRLSYLNDGECEWALFVGSVGNDFRSLKDETRDVITYMAASMKLCEAPQTQPEKDPAISLGGEAESAETALSASGNEIPPTDKKTDTQVKEEPAALVSESQNVSEEKDKTAEDIQTEKKTEHTQEEIDDMMPETPVEIVQTEDIPETQDVQETEENMPEIEESPSMASSDMSVVKADNQKEATVSSGTIYQSDIYSQLPLGKKACATALMSEGSFGNVEVCADRILTGKEAQKMIQDAFNRKTVYGDYFDPPEGCSWHAVHYTVSFPSDLSCYLNVKLRGMDGEDLKFRGIIYPHRTYDIKVSETEFYAFYAVPNGCPEYVLEIGEGHAGSDERFSAAYYRYEKK